MQALTNVLFDNVGHKIKTMATIIFILGFIGSAISGVIIMYDWEEYFIGFLIWIAGILLSWASSLFVYGFGKLIEKAAETAENTQKA